ncbi:restriction endonuclease subunit S [Ureibacillus thermophilus]|uniref:Restriction endonuclease subunit S n=1 Tax=Ureibacillus thermophilus TaxID=367743 RepID=A0A4P6UNG5_9BACL|nr:restriction endonuclease subunit S [Ureibacillus thermophilus]QBK24494.1 restriction endonuclease subunit S [Ureibacillus thermophilus]
MKKYTEYKDSGVKWIGQIPSHWEISRIRSVTKVKSIKNKPNERLLSIYRDYGVIYKDSRDDNHNVASEDLSTYKFVEPSDLVINKMKAWQGSLAISEYQGIISPAYIICEVSDSIYPRYLHYLLRSKGYIGAYKSISYGVRIGQWDMRYEDFKKLPLLVPPLEEQKMIADYLDKKLNEIDLLIEIKEKQIELFKEKQRKIIDDYILNGINHKKTKKVDEVWLASIPEDWHLIPLKHIVQEINISRDDIREDEIYLSLDRIESKTGKFKIEDGNVEFDSKVKEFKETDILFNKLRPYLAKVVFPKRKGVCVGELLVLRPKVKTVLPEYLHYVLLSPSFINLVDSSTYGTKMPRANWEFIGNQKIPIPRKIEEQKQIVELIKQRTQVIDDFIKYTEEYIAKIKEYRQTLISNVVTGRFNICHLISKGGEEFANGYVGA